MKYKVRCSSFSTLLGGCGKVRNCLEWNDIDNWNEAHIKLAIEIYNHTEGIFTPAEITTLDMSAGNENESDTVKLYDEFFGTNYFTDYEISRSVTQKFNKSNDYLTGSRDFGNDVKTIDAKCSTDKNVFDAKKFVPLETDYIIQQNGYSLLYGTPELELYNALMPATFGQIKKFTDNKAYIEMLSDTEKDEYQFKLEDNYSYQFLPLSKRISVREIPLIDGFSEIVKKRVTILNNWIESNKHKL